MSNANVKNVNEKIFTKKLEEYNNLLVKRDDIKSAIKIIGNTINYINDYENEENPFRKDISKLTIGCNLYENSINWNLSLKRIKDDERPSFTWRFNAVTDKDIVINMLKSVIDAYEVRYVNINKKIEEYDFLEVK